ncbi:probable glycosyltransferase STELLO1 [Camellia sinensis]|uniref:probable glycosyltransferase STELLO1 n=1 Tax=Camellia sinensis TaxID=4442 RepID=UPI0010356835|nr:probable glycosyltransferase STELLO1 [Camellia sinensis]
MLVQDRSTPKSPKTQNRALPTLHPNRRFSESKSLDFSTWVSENLYKIVAIGLLIATVAALFFLRNVGDTAALLCFESQAQQLDKIHFPQINWNSIEPILDQSTPYSNFRSDRWIVVSVSNYPTDSLRNLAKIKGWQVLAIGNSKTPGDWNLKGTIFLSLEQQALLGFRVVDYLPYDSYVRKTVGYLFAIQHGAKKIFDADDRGDVIDNDIGKHFDVELIGEDARQDVILQYSHENPNRTIVNPYIHFGQRSVWPRGLPLENVGEIGHEEYYTEVFGGKQFIQQGISNGLPDVDSVFYFTRKSGLEALDIRFDEHAPKVALPQGTMVPVNSFNTIYHSSAFWGLMLPVSVSTMASDVLRGYWAQRLLWEIGGYVVVYPPTVHRYDRIEAYPFSEEKDLHIFSNSVYRHLPTIFNRFTSAEGFLFLQDDTILNYWNLLQADKTKLWITDKVSESWSAVKTEGNADWFTKQADMVKKVVSSMPVHFQISYKESMTNDHSLTVCNSEVFYVPRRFVVDFIDLVNLVGDLDIHQKVAIPMFFLGMDSPQNFDSVLSTMIYKQEPPSTNSSSFYSPEVPAIHPWKVSSEQDFIKLIRIMAAGDPLLMELV